VLAVLPLQVMATSSLPTHGAIERAATRQAHPVRRPIGPSRLQESFADDLERSGATQQYRLTCRPSFADNVIVTVQVYDAGTASLVVKRSRNRRTAPEKLITNRGKTLSKAEVSSFLEMVSEMNFWNLPTRIDVQPDLDGEDWRLEAIRNGRYHVVTRGSPKPGVFRGAAVQMLKLADLSVCAGYTPLGQFELSRLKFIAIRKDGSVPVAALVEAPDGAIESVKIGDGLGADFGVVREITQDYLKISEMVIECSEDENGEWIERANYLPRSGAHVQAEISTIVRAINAEQERRGYRCVSSR
jgi:hypothetical protein